MASTGGPEEVPSSTSSASLNMPASLPYDGDINLNVAIQTALSRNDTTALRVLFQAQKNRNKSGAPRKSELTLEAGDKLRLALEAVGLTAAVSRGSRKRKRAAMQSESKEESEMKEEKREDEEEDEGEDKGDLVEACKTALKSHDLPPPEQPPNATADGITPQLLRTLSTESLWYYTLGVVQPDGAPRKVLGLLRGIAQLQYNNTITSEAARVLKTAVGNGQLHQVETILRDVYSVEPSSEANAEDEAGAEDALQAEFRCPITQDLFYEPSTLTCGHTFERQGILDHLKTCQRVGNPAVCPTCRQPINKEEQKKLGVNKVLQGLLRRFYSAQMESLAEREVEKAATGPPQNAERIMEILERYPENMTILRRTVAAFEVWAKDSTHVKTMATDRVMAGLLRALRDPLRLQRALDEADLRLEQLIIGLLALVTQEGKACRVLIRLGFLKDVVKVVGTETPTIASLVLVRNLMTPDGFTCLLRRAKKEASIMPSIIEHLNGISIGLFNAANRPNVQQDARMSIYLLTCLNRLALLATHEGVLACQVDFSALSRAVVALWDQHARLPAVATRALRALRSFLDLTAPSNIPGGLTPQACLSNSFYLDRCLRALSEFQSLSATSLEARTAVGEGLLLLLVLAFDDRGGQRDPALLRRLLEAGLVDKAETFLTDEGLSQKLLGYPPKTFEDFRFDRVSDPSKVVVSGDGKQLELNGAGWALGPPLKHGQTTLIMELGKAGCNLESLWWGVCVLDKATDEAGNLDPGTSINAGNSPFIVRKEGTLYTHGRSDRYLYLTSPRPENRLTLQINRDKKIISLGSARVGYQSLENKVIRPAIVTMPPSSGRRQTKYKVAAKDFQCGFMSGPQPVRLKPLCDQTNYLGRGKVVRCPTLAKPLTPPSPDDNPADGAATSTSSGSASGGAAPWSSATPQGSSSASAAPQAMDVVEAAQPVFAFAVGPGESSDEQEVLFRFRSVRKMSALCFGVVGVGRRTPPSTDPPDNGKGRKRGASSKASETTSVEGEGTELPAEVVFILTVMSTGEIILRGPSLKTVVGHSKVFGITARRQVRVTWGPKGTMQVLAGATSTAKLDNGEVETLWDGRHLLKSLLSRSDVVVHPFVGLQKGGDWATVRVVTPKMYQVCSRSWLERCLETARHVAQDGDQSGAGDMKALARNGVFLPAYGSLLRASLEKEGEYLHEFVPVPKRNKVVIHMYGYDARTLRELCKARHATKVQRMNMLALPEPTQDMVHVNSVAVCGRAERVWLLGLKWAMDRDMYTIELLTELVVPAGMKAGLGGDEESQGSGGHKQHECFEIPVHPPFCITGGLNIGLAFAGEGSFIWSFRNHKYVQPDVLVMALSDDVPRDMVVGKELCMEEQTEEQAMGFGLHTTEGLPDDTCTTTDVLEGSYRVGAWEMPESSDEEGQVRVTRYRRPRYDVLVRADGAQTMGHDQDTDDEESEELEAVGAEDALAQFL